MNTDTTPFGNFLERLKRLARQVAGFFPSRLPNGMAEFDAWVDYLQSTYSLPTSDRDSLVFMLGSMIMHGGPSDAYKSKFHFVVAIRAAAAKQIAGAAFHAVKEKHKAAELAAKTAEATALPGVASSGQQV